MNAIVLSRALTFYTSVRDQVSLLYTEDVALDLMSFRRFTFPEIFRSSRYLKTFEKH